jgi:hypothetical protein
MRSAELTADEFAEPATGTLLDIFFRPDFIDGFSGSLAWV